MPHELSSISRQPGSVIAFYTTLPLLVAGCLNDGPCPARVTDLTTQSAIAGDAPYVSSGDPYAIGPLEVRTIDIAKCSDAAPAPLRIHAPTQPGTYAVVVFQHGFQSRNSDYDDILTHLASHGFVVVAPQMYAPGIGPAFGDPTAAAESELAATVLDWLPAHLSEASGVTVALEHLGMAGHSRGGKVAWGVLKSDPSRAQAIAGVDPVDGTGGPLGGQARVIDGPFDFAIPSLVIGTALGGSCAPEGDNHVQFFDASAAPAWHIVALDYGHADMLDEDTAVFSAAVCQSGPNRETMRTLTAGLLAAFFRGVLQNDPSSLPWLIDVSAAPAAMSVESK